MLASPAATWPTRCVQYRHKSKSIAIADTMSFLDDRLLATLGLRRQNIEENAFGFNTGVSTSGYDAARNTPIAASCSR